MSKYILIAPTMTNALATHLEGSTLWHYYAPGKFWISSRELTSAQVTAERNAGGRNSTHIIVPLSNVVNSLA